MCVEGGGVGFCPVAVRAPPAGWVGGGIEERWHAVPIRSDLRHALVPGNLSPLVAVVVRWVRTARWEAYLITAGRFVVGWVYGPRWLATVL